MRNRSVKDKVVLFELVAFMPSVDTKLRHQHVLFDFRELCCKIFDEKYLCE